MYYGRHLSIVDYNYGQLMKSWSSKNLFITDREGKVHTSLYSYAVADITLWTYDQHCIEILS